MAAQAWPEAGFFGGGRTGYEPNVLESRSGSGTYGTAVDAGCDDGYEEASVEALIAALHGEVAELAIEGHRASIRIVVCERWPFSDVNVGAGGLFSTAACRIHTYRSISIAPWNTPRRSMSPPGRTTFPLLPASEHHPPPPFLVDFDRVRFIEEE